MPIQTGNMPAKGSMNNMSYFHSKDGLMVKMKSVTNKSKYKTDSMVLTRRNGQEFGLAGRAGKTLRYAVQKAIGKAKDPRNVSRLTTLMLSIAKKDFDSPHGERNVSKGPLEDLKGFDFNINAPLAKHFSPEITYQIDRVTGKLNLEIPAFETAALLNIPHGATHFKVVSAGCEVNFVEDKYVSKEFDSGQLPLNSPAAAISIVHELEPNSTLPLFLTFGILFFQEINRAFTPIQSPDANSFGIVEVDYV